VLTLVVAVLAAAYQLELTRLHALNLCRRLVCCMIMTSSSWGRSDIVVAGMICVQEQHKLHAATHPHASSGRWDSGGCVTR
jgi:hypothetical protein